MTELVRWYLGPTIEFELQPLLAAGVEPAWMGLGSVLFDEVVCSSRLGWSSWLEEEAMEAAAGDAVFAEREPMWAEA